MNDENSLYSKIVQEIISTEKSYLNQLEKVILFFSDVILEKKYISKESHSVIFGQLSSIYQINSKLYEEISNGKESIGLCFLKFGPFLKVYSSYANNFQRALTLLQELLTKSTIFKEFVNATETRPEVQSKLTSLLIIPIQRIPRYKLLLEELLKVAQSSLSIYNEIKGALVKVSDAADHINQSVDDAESLQRLLTLQKALRNQQPNIIIPGRKLIKDGILNKVSRKGKGSQPRIFFLFSDMIMYTKVPLQPLNTSSKSNLSEVFEVNMKVNSLECCCLLPLRYCRVTTVLGSSQHGITFRLQCADEDLLLYSHNSTDGKKWITAIEETAFQALQKRKTLRKVSTNNKAIRRSAFKKFSDDENSPRKSPFTRSQKTEFLKSRLLRAKECLTPPRLLTPRRKKDKVVLPAIVTTPLSGPRILRMSTKNSPRITSPLAVPSSPKDASMELADYSNRPSFTLRLKMKEQHLLSPSPTLKTPVKCKKRPISEYLTPTYIKNKRRKNTH